MQGDKAGNLDFILSPQSIAVVGASSTAGKWGNRILLNLLEAGFQGRIYPVNPRASDIVGLRSYSRVEDIEDSVDLAVIGIPASMVLGAIEDCGRKRVRGAVIMTAGFAELGQEGKRLQDSILAAASNSGMRVVGPNCLGIISASSRLNASPLPYVTGNLALISQSGNFCQELMVLARRAGLGFSKMVSIGNQIDVGFEDVISAIEHDSDSRVIMLFVEALHDGASFLRHVGIPGHKPVVVLKVGQTSSGARAAMSHTGSLAGADSIYEGVFKQAGVVRVSRTHELLAVAEAMSKLPSMNGNRIVVLTDGGGHAAAGADVAEKHGLIMPALPHAVEKRLLECMLPQSSARNPVDFAGAAEYDLWNYKRVMEIILSQQDVDGLLVVGAEFGGYAEVFGQESLEIDVATEIARLAHYYEKPVIVHSPYAEEGSASIGVMRQSGVPVYGEVETAAVCMAAQAKYWDYQRRALRRERHVPSYTDRVGTVESILQRIRKAGRLNAVEPEAMKVLEAYGVRVPYSRLASTPREASEIAREFTGQVVVKVCSPQIIHKTDARGVRVGLRPSDVEEACSDVLANAREYDRSAEVYGCLVCEMLQEGLEMIVGGIRDQGLGPLVMVGLGGIYAEALQDASFRIAPVVRGEAYEMIQELRGHALLSATRGQTQRDADALSEIIVYVSRLLADHSEILELDVNPVVVFESGASAADARLLLTHERSVASGSTR
jgi:acetyltransferase